MMVEIAVLTPTPITALSAFVTIQKIVPLGLLFLKLEMVSVMTGLTMLTAIMMAETAVDTISTLTFVLIVNAMTMRLVQLVFIFIL